MLDCINGSATVGYKIRGEDGRRVRFEPRGLDADGQGSHFRVEEEWTGKQWRECGRELVSNIHIHVADGGTGATHTVVMGP